MQDNRKKLHAKKAGCAGLLLAVLCILGGCTKKEELLLIDGETAVSAETGSAAKTGEEEAGADSAAKIGPQTGSLEEQAEPAVIWVHVCGAVRRPGVYELRAGSRVYEAVRAAEGFTAEADQDYVNQAQELADGVKLVIPTVEEAAQMAAGGESFFAGPEGGGQAENGDGRININTASEAQLCGIPGIGATRAAAIAAYRESHGAFQKPEDIMKVNGIKEGMYEKIKDSISVD